MKSAVGHRNKKNPKSAEAYQKARRERNSIMKQEWVGGKIVEGGHWKHTFVGQRTGAAI